VTDKEILEGVETVNKFKQMAKESPDGSIMITKEERESIMRGTALMNSNTNDLGQLVIKPFRMCGFVPMNIPILCGLVLAKPTMTNTIFFQWANQSYNAGLNYGNKNSTCSYTNQDLFKGYITAVSSALMVAITLRKLTGGMTKGATCLRLLALNTFVNGTAGGCASFCNTYCMRMAETQKGIDVYSDEECKQKVGVSKECAKSAVMETAFSRSAMSSSTCVIPAVLIASLSAIGFAPKGQAMKNLKEIGCVTIGLAIGLPMSVSIFPPISVKKGDTLEAEFKSHDNIYFSKGL